MVPVVKLWCLKIEVLLCVCVVVFRARFEAEPFAWARLKISVYFELAALFICWLGGGGNISVGESCISGICNSNGGLG